MTFSLVFLILTIVYFFISFPSFFFFGSTQVIDLNTQVRYFKNIEKLLRQELGDAEAKRLLGRALYIISIGSNDYLAPIVQNSSMLRSYSKDEYVAMVIGNLTVSIKVIILKYRNMILPFVFLSYVS